MARSNSLYQTTDLRHYIDAENFGLLLVNTNAKYNTAIWRRYANWGTPTDDREWKQGQKKTPIMVRASILGTHSPKPMRNTEGWSAYGGSIPKIGHGFTIDESDLIEIRKNSKLANLTFGVALTDSFVTNSDNMLGGIHNEISHMTLQALSTAAIKEVSIDGASYDFQFPIDDNHFMSTDPGKEWYKKQGNKLVANEAADPIKDIRDWQDYLTDTLNLAVDHWKMSKSLLNLLLKHPAVVKAYKASKNYFHPEDVKVVKADVLSWLHSEMEIWMFDVIDFKSRHEEDGIPVNDEPAFDKHNMVACSSQIVPFEIKCMNSIYKDRMGMGGQTNANLYSLVEDRIAVLNTWQERPIQNIVDCELYAAPVFNNLNEYGVAKCYTD